MRLRLVVTTWTIMPTPGPLALKIYFLVLLAFELPRAARQARSMLSLACLILGARMAVRGGV